MLHKHLDTMSALGRFAKGLPASNKKTSELPRTFIGTKGTVGKTDEFTPVNHGDSPLKKSMKGIIHWETENYEVDGEIDPQPMDVHPEEEYRAPDQETVKLSLKLEDLMGSRHFRDAPYGVHKDMIGKFLVGIRQPATSKADEIQKNKDELLVEEYLSIMKEPAATQEQVEKKQKLEEAMARYLSETKHVNDKASFALRRDHTDML